MTPAQGWVALLDKQLDEMSCAYDVVNASISGETTAGGLTRLPRLLELNKPSIVIVELGSNDGLRGFPVKELRGNLEQIVALSQAAGAGVVLVGMQIPSNYGRRYTESFANIFSEIAMAKGAALLPFFLDGISEDESLMQADTIHPNALAQPLLQQMVLNLIDPMLSCARVTP